MRRRSPPDTTAMNDSSMRSTHSNGDRRERLSLLELEASSSIDNNDEWTAKELHVGRRRSWFAWSSYTGRRNVVVAVTSVLGLLFLSVLVFHGR